MNNKFQENIHNQILEQLNLIEMIGMGIDKKGTCLVALAYEYFNMNWDKEGTDLLLQVSDEYFQKHMLRELENDSQFHQLTIDLISLMMKSEYLKTLDPSFFSFLVNMKGIPNV